MKPFYRTNPPSQADSLAARFIRSPLTDALVVIAALREQVTCFGATSDLAWRLAALAAKIETHLVLPKGRESLGTKVNQTAEGRAKIDAAITALMVWALERGLPWSTPCLD